MKDLRLVSVGVEVEREFPADTLSVSISLSGESESRNACNAACNSVLSSVREALSAVGIPADEVRNGQYELFPHVEKIYMRDGGSDRYFVERTEVRGYEYSSSLYLTRDRSAGEASAIWAALSALGDEVFFTLSFGLGDEASARASLLEEAIARGRDEAETLARAAGAKLIGIHSINYEYNPEGFSSRSHIVRRKSIRNEEGPTFFPTDVAITCAVDMQWCMEPAG